MALMKNFFRQYVWAHLPEKITRKQCLREALIWGGGFILLAWLFHRWGKLSDPAFWTLASIGGAIAVLLPIPGVGEKTYLFLLRIFAVFGFVIGTTGLTLIFYLMVTPLGWALRLSGKDPLRMRASGPPSWIEHPGNDGPKRYYRLF